MSKLKFVFKVSQKRHVRVAISQKELVNFFQYAHQIEAFFSPVHTQVSLFMGRFFHTELHSENFLASIICWDIEWVNSGAFPRNVNTIRRCEKKANYLFCRHPRAFFQENLFKFWFSAPTNSLESRLEKNKDYYIFKEDQITMFFILKLKRICKCLS